MQLRHYLSLEDREEAILIRPPFVERDMVPTGFEELSDGLEMLLGIRTANDVLRDVILNDEFDRLLEASGVGRS